ncbi:MAG: hypothetical protein Q9157_006985 [Trypethelium eluteriae]
MDLSPEEISYEEAHIHDNRAYQQNIPVAIFGLLAFICVVLRPVCRRLSGTLLGLDDWLIIASMPLRKSQRSILSLSVLRSLLRSDREKSAVSDSRGTWPTVADDQGAAGREYDLEKASTGTTARSPSRDKDMGDHELDDMHLPIVERPVV